MGNWSVIICYCNLDVYFTVGVAIVVAVVEKVE